jgi:hypothetical protein
LSHHHLYRWLVYHSHFWVVYGTVPYCTHIIAYYWHAWKPLDLEGLVYRKFPARKLREVSDRQFIGLAIRWSIAYCSSTSIYFGVDGMEWQEVIQLWKKQCPVPSIEWLLTGNRRASAPSTTCDSRGKGCWPSTPSSLSTWLRSEHGGGFFTHQTMDAKMVDCGCYVLDTFRNTGRLWPSHVEALRRTAYFTQTILNQVRWKSFSFYHLPSGKLTVCYWKWHIEIVGLPI